MQEAKPPPSALGIVRMTVPSWFIFAGPPCAMLFHLEGNQALSAILFGAFLAQATYFVFFSRTILPLFPESRAYMRNVFGIFAVAFLAFALVFFFS